MHVCQHQLIAEAVHELVILMEASPQHKVYPPPFAKYRPPRAGRGLYFANLGRGRGEDTSLIMARTPCWLMADVAD